MAVISFPKRFKRLLPVALFCAALTVSAATPARAGSVLFGGPPVNCFGVPLVCVSGGPGFPLAWGFGSFFGSFTLGADSIVEGLELWGGGVSGVTLWSSQQLCPICPPIPDQQIAALSFGGGTSTFFGIGEPQSGGIPFFDFSLTLATPVFLAGPATYYLGFQNAQLLPSFNDFVYFSSPPPFGQVTIPGIALRVIGQSPVPEPATLLLLGTGLAAVAARRRSSSRR